jgi:DNA-binding NtrC family response regulator
MGHRILVIDDRESILFAISDYLTANGYRVDCARKIEEAKMLLSHIRYSVVISDLHLTGSEGAEGLEIVEQVRERFPSTRTILMTAHDAPDVEIEAKRLGVDAFLYKSRPLPEFAQLITMLVN